MSEFDRCSPWIVAALEYAGGTHDLEDVRQAIAEHRMQLWPGERSVLVTELVQYPRLRAVRVFCGGGDLSELREMEPCVAEWGRLNGCSRIEGFGREGWSRVGRRNGWKDVRVFMWRPL